MVVLPICFSRLFNLLQFSFLSCTLLCCFAALLSMRNVLHVSADLVQPSCIERSLLGSHMEVSPFPVRLKTFVSSYCPSPYSNYVRSILPFHLLCATQYHCNTVTSNLRSWFIYFTVCTCTPGIQCSKSEEMAKHYFIFLLLHGIRLVSHSFPNHIIFINMTQNRTPLKLCKTTARFSPLKIFTRYYMIPGLVEGFQRLAGNYPCLSYFSPLSVIFCASLVLFVCVCFVFFSQGGRFGNFE